MDQKLQGSEILENNDSLKSDNSEITEQEYVNISKSPEFNALVKKKNKFIFPISIFFLLFYFTLPVLSSFTKVLHQKAIGDITWIWVFALAQFIMVWTLVTIYVKKANSFDKDAGKIIEKVKDGDYK